MYIRTKDGRILDFDKLNEVSKLSIDMAEEPIREAETIEELCDEFVGVDKTCENDFIHKGHNKVIKQAKIGYIKDISPPKTEPKKFTIDTIYKITPAKRVT